MVDMTGNAPAMRVGPQSTAIGRRGGSSFTAAHLFLIVLLIPSQFFFTIGGALITPVRLFIICMILPTLLRVLRSRRPFFFKFDAFYFLFVSWTIMCMFMNRGFSGGFQLSGQFALEYAGVYIIARAYIDNEEKIKSFISLFFWLIFILFILAVPEAFLKEHFLFDFAQALAGLPPLELTRAGERLGLLRVTSVFSHPILYGQFCATALALVWMLQPTTSAALSRASVIVGATALSLSSAPILIVGAQMMLLLIERLTRGMAQRFLIVVSIIVSIVAALNIFTGRGVFGIIILFTLNSSTAFYRRIIWELGSADVMRHPIFGFRPEEWNRLFWMSPSIDNYWLLMAMQGGLPAVIFLGIAILLLTYAVFKVPEDRLTPTMVRLRLGWGFMVVGFVLCGFTVHFFDKIQPFFALMIGLGGAVLRILMAMDKSGGNSALGQASARPTPQRRTVL